MLWSNMYSQPHEVHDPLGHGGGLHANAMFCAYSLTVRGCPPADAADAAGDEMRVPRILPLMKNACKPRKMDDVEWHSTTSAR